MSPLRQLLKRPDTWLIAFAAAIALVVADAYQAPANQLTARAYVAGVHAYQAVGRPLLAGGKSMGGRMSSLAAAEGMLADVRALVFFGFPLHPAGRPGTERGDHLSRVAVPMLFMQGTRDTLAELTLLRPICERLGGRATLHIIEGADHGFHVRKSAGRTDADVLDELADTVQSWAAALGV